MAGGRFCCQNKPFSSPGTAKKPVPSEPIGCAPISPLPNYANNLLRSGFTEDDLSSVSDRLFDAIIAWGDEDTIVRRVREHRDAGADHICVQALTADRRKFPREQWRRLAAALT